LTLVETLKAVPHWHGAIGARHGLDPIGEAGPSFAISRSGSHFCGMAAVLTDTVSSHMI
jgi:hypothetical protein